MKNVSTLIILFSCIFSSGMAQAKALQRDELYSASVRLNISKNIPLATEISNKIGAIISGTYPFSNESVNDGSATLEHKENNRFILTLKDNTRSKKCQIPPMEIVMDRGTTKENALHGYGVLDNSCNIIFETTSDASFTVSVYRTYIDSFVYKGCEKYCPGFGESDYTTEYNFYNHDIYKKLMDFLSGI